MLGKTGYSLAPTVKLVGKSTNLPNTMPFKVQGVINTSVWRPPTARGSTTSTAGAGLPAGSPVIAGLGPGMEREVAEAAWTHVTAGTAAAEARVVWESVEDTLMWFTCSATYHGGKLGVRSDCGGYGLVIEEALEFTVRSWRGAG